MSELKTFVKRPVELSPAKRALVEKMLRGEALEASRAARIQRRAEGGPALLSFPQRRLWFFEQLEPGTSIYNLPVTVTLRGRLNVEVLRRVLNEIVRRHESLRTTFTSVEGRPRQVIAPAQFFALPVSDLSDLPADGREAEMRRSAHLEAERPFDIEREHLMRAKLLRLEDEFHALVVTIHHIVSDGWSFGVLKHELATLYGAFVEGRPSPLPELPIQYADYAEWQRGWLRGEALERQLSYWRRQLEGAPPVLNLPTDRPRPKVMNFQGATATLTLPAPLAEGLKALGLEEGATLFVSLLAAFKTLLFRYTGQPDIVVGTPVANRHHVETESLIGFFVNTLVLRSKLSGGLSFRQLLGRVREMTIAAQAHQDLPFERLVEELQPERSINHAPLFQVSFTQLNAPTAVQEVAGLKLGSFFVDKGTAKFDLAFSVQEHADGVSCGIQYSVELFEAETIRRMLLHFKALLEGAVATPDKSLSELPLLSPGERRRVLDEWSHTPQSYELGDACLHQLFERQAALTPDAPALLFGSHTLSYAALNARANRLARRLLRRGVGRGDLVAVCLEPSFSSVVSVLAVLKAGAAYLPLDPSYPSARLRLMLEDAAPRLLLTRRELLERLPVAALPTPLCLTRDGRVDEEVGDAGVEEREAWAEADDANPDRRVAPLDLAYVIYTSGSTGRPKGVMGTHRGAVNRCLWMWQSYPLAPREVHCHKTSLGFVDSVWEIFGALGGGAALVIASAEEARDPRLLAGLAARAGVSRLVVVPSLLRALLDVEDVGELLSGVRYWSSSGEALTAELASEFRARLGAGSTLLNLYGSTEVAADATWWEAEAGAAEVRIGRAMGNVRCYVLDERGEPAPVGVAGELHVGGEGLARGYLGRAAETAERFVPDGFGREPGGRLYRTGDVARFDVKGRLDYLGRADGQVKVRGMRVEVGEVERALAAVAGVREAVVVLAGVGAEERRLVAYVVADDGAEVAGVREALRERLPEYMVPAAYVQLGAMPRTPSGKVNRLALPAAEASDGLVSAEGYVAPRTPTEELLAGIWSEVLGVERVGVRDNFFDIGGHSLLATQVMSRVRGALGVDLPLRSMFETPTIARFTKELEKAVSSNEGVKTPPITRAPRDAPPSLSFSQQRLWFMHHLEPGSPAYHICFNAVLEGRLNVEALEQSINLFAARHESLRTNFAIADGRPVQVIKPPRPVRLTLIDLRHLPETAREAEAKRLAMAEAVRPFDLVNEPLFRISLLRLGEDRFIMPVTMHHIISDGWSIEVMFRELATLYGAFVEGRPSPLAEPPIQYADYAEWQRGWLRGGLLERQLSYWREQLDGAPPVLDLPTDRPRPAVKTFRGAFESVRLSEELTRKLRESSRRHGATLFMTLLAGYQTLLHKYSGQRGVVVGTPIAGRNLAETEGLIGFLVNTLVLRTNFGGDPSFGELVARVREVTLGAHSHQDVPFQKLVEELHHDRTLSHTPLFQAAFGFGAAQQKELSFEGVTLKVNSMHNGSAKVDLSMTLEDAGKEIHGTLSYSRDLFDRPTVERMVKHFERLLEAVVADAARPISQISLLTPDERTQILEGRHGRPSPTGPTSTLPDLFEAQAARTPDAVAVVCRGESLSYAELNGRANQLARHLRGLGLTPETVVGVCVERSPEMLVGLLGILKAGGAYLPLEPDTPPGRLAFMLGDAQAGLLLTQETMLSRLPQHGARVVLLDSGRHLFDRESAENLPPVARAENHAYVIYTSGSTGRPKGVAITHASACTLLRWAWEEFGRESLSRVLASTSVCFDLSVFELFAPLTCGGSVVLAASALDLLDERGWVGSREAGVTLVNTVPSAMAELVRAGRVPETATVVALAGEPLKRGLAEAVYAFPQVERLYNLYGPTEDTTYSTFSLVARGSDREPLIGLPVANTRAYVLDSRMEPVPEGVKGELYLGGAGLARGYLNRPAMTAERFVPDPFSGEEGARLYRTGDVVRWGSTGELEFLGRVDHQVKVRGFRIELGEVESALALHPGVRAAAVVVREDAPGDKRLAAYFVAGDAHAASADELRAFLKERLPSYMLPSVYVCVDALPLTSGGKVDRRALPEPDDARPELAQKYVAPQTPLEETVAGVWSEVLRVERVGTHDNFFDIGGHSLLIVQVNDILQKMLGRETSITDMFKYPTIKALCDYLSAGENAQDLTGNGPEVYEARRKGMRRRRQQRHSRSHT